MSNEILNRIPAEWRVVVEYTDGGIASNWFLLKADAEAWAEEECEWEGTHHAVIRGPDKYECFYMGVFS